MSSSTGTGCTINVLDVQIWGQCFYLPSLSTNFIHKSVLEGSRSEGMDRKPLLFILVRNGLTNKQMMTI